MPDRSNPSEVFLRKGVLKICSKFTGEYPCRSAISIELQSNFIEITLRYRCSPVNLLHISRTPFPKNNSGWLLLYVDMKTLTIYHAIFESRPLLCFGRKKSSSVKRLHILQKKSLRLMFFLK